MEYKMVSERTRKQAIKDLDYVLSLLLDARMEAQRELAKLQEIDLWEPEKLTHQDRNKMANLRKRITDIKFYEVEVKEKMAKLL